MATVHCTKNCRILRLPFDFIRQLPHASKNSLICTRRSVTSGVKDENVISGVVTVEFRQGLPVVTLPLPTNGENCQFAIRPIGNTIGEFVQLLKKEDKAVENVVVYNSDGVRLSNSTGLDYLTRSNFRIRINDKIYSAQLPQLDKDLAKSLDELSEIRRLVNSLYSALNANEEKVREEKLITDKLDEIQAQLEPLEKERRKLAEKSEKVSSRLLWLGLGLMGVQAGVLGRLTWYEYSWDIMEPVTYFVTYSAVMGGFAYYVATRTPYEYHEASDRLLYSKFHKVARKSRFDVNKYNELRTLYNDLESHLKSLRRSSSIIDSIRALENVHNANVSAAAEQSSTQEKVSK